MTFEGIVGGPFERIYQEGTWGEGSGPGSSPIATRNTAASLVALTHALGVYSVLDLGCGDGQWMPDLPGYIGLDPSPTAVRMHQQRHPDRRVAWYPGNHVLPRAHLVLVRDVIQHLSLGDGIVVLSDALAASHRWLLATTYLGGSNVDIESGAGAYSPDLTVAPFGLGQPVAWIFDGWSYEDPDAIRDTQRFLGLWSAR